MNREQLEKSVGIYETVLAELARLQSEEPRLQEQERTITAELARLPSDKLIGSPPDGDHFDSVTDGKLRILDVARTKLRLLPNVRARLQAQLDQCRQQINSAGKQLLGQLRDASEAKLEELRASECTRALPICGGDMERAQAAANAVVEQSEGKQWLDTLRYHGTNTDPVRHARRIVAEIAAFEAGKTVRSVDDAGQ